MKIEVYTDGSATTKDKPGGYGWVIVVNGTFYMEGSGSIPSATNNDAELEAAVIGLSNVLREWNEGRLGESNIKSLGMVNLVSDSQIILGWTSGKYRFKQEAKRKKYDQLQYLVERLRVNTRWVRGHSGDQWNERCDELAGKQRDAAMGVVRKPRTSRIKPLKEACENMMDALRYVREQISILEDDNNGGRANVDVNLLCDIQDRIGKSLEFYKEKING